LPAFPMGPLSPSPLLCASMCKDLQHIFCWPDSKQSVWRDWQIFPIPKVRWFPPGFCIFSERKVSPSNRRSWKSRRRQSKLRSWSVWD
jgi:hypothetical protein